MSFQIALELLSIPVDPKFVVVEIDSKERALQLVQVMLDNGFACFMLLDDLSKHPTLGKNPKDNCREVASSQEFFEQQPSYPEEEQKVLFPAISQESNSMVSSTGIKQEEPLNVDVTAKEDEIGEEEEEEILLTRKRPPKRTYNQTTDVQVYREQLMNMLCGEPEIVPIGVNSSDEPSTSPKGSTPNQIKTGEYHQCRICGVRVKTHRSGRWNLQMHVIALHCVGRHYRCKKCEYVDYRKSTMRKHTISQHGMDIPPHNIADDAMRAEWHSAMIKCFPEFAHRTGFLQCDSKNQ